ncbi:MAG TPA: protein kinase, partial [Haliangium sp.]|nr:protein kinase [Haliangium sp.]
MRPWYTRRRMLDLPASFGKYFLTEKIATGGMAEIYLAKLIGPGGFEKQLVIKQIHPELGGKPAFVDLFVAEAKTLVSLSHGNIVPIYELGLVEDRYFIAMEYIDGPTLERLQRSLAARGQVMEPALAAHVTAEILKGLDYAHRKGEGVIHRDLSPRNVMLSREGEVKLVDFGIAVPLGHERERDGGVPVGSFPYMSPEQVRGERLTGQSDVFSAGVLLWEMLVGRSLFARPSAEDTLAAVTDAPIAPPSAHRDGVPAALDAICARALTREPSARYPSAAVCLADVHRWLYSLAEPVAPVTLSRLVAACCPPTVQRAAVEDPGLALATTDAASASDMSPGTVPLPRRGSERGGAGDAGGEGGGGDEDRDAGDTVRLARAQDETRARGKRRAATEQSFATHVEIERVLSGSATALPLADSEEPDDGAVGDGAVGDGAAGVSVHEDRNARAPAAGLGARRAVPGGADLGSGRGADLGSGRDPWRGTDLGSGQSPRRMWLAGAALALVAGAAIMLLGRTSGLPEAPAVHAQPDAPIATATPGPVRPALPAPSGPTAVPASAPGTAGAVEDPGAGTPADAPGPAVRRTRPPAGTDRSPRVRPPAQGEDATAQRTAGAAPAAAGGTLKVGANPWGEVYLDGVRLGRTPHAWQVPAGAHVVEVVFPVG